MAFKNNHLKVHMDNELPPWVLKTHPWMCCSQKASGRIRIAFFQIVHLDIRAVSACDQLLKELKHSEFILKEQHQNQEHNYWLFAKGVYTVSIYKFNSPLLPLSVELHGL